MYSTEQKLMILASHLSLLVGFPVIIPLVIYLIKKDEDVVVAENAKEALNFHISLFIYSFIGGILMIVLIGFLLVPAIGLAGVVLSIVGAVKSIDGKPYRYPFILRFIK